MMHKDFFTSILIDKTLIDEQKLEYIYKNQGNTSFLDQIINAGVSYDDIKSIMKNSFDIDYYDLYEIHFEKSIIEYLNYETVVKYNALPIKKDEDKLILAMEYPLNLDAIDDIELMTNLNIVPVLSKSLQIKYYISLFYGNSQINSITTQFLSDESKMLSSTKNTNTKDIDSPVSRLIDSLIETAVRFRASDIHIEPYEKIVRTRYRVDGHLSEFEQIDVSFFQNILSRFKIIASMDISEKRLPQDGHFEMSFENQKVNFRISTMPTMFGEKIVIRIIYSQNDFFDKSKLGFFDQDIEKINNILQDLNGAVLVTGPTGSGKTTTLMSLIKSLNNQQLNIITIEDPVENLIFGVNQINVNAKIGLHFETILRSVLRQDPDVIMVGEIRDNETADISIKAALTGHLVLTTLHTKDAISAILRLIDMNIEEYILSVAIKCIISQRLVRRLCDDCKVATTIKDEDSKLLKIPKGQIIYSKKGCNKCNGIGYKGRFAIYELITMDNELRDFIENKKNKQEIRNFLKKNKIDTIWECAIKNVILGKTTISEMYKAVFSF